MAVIFTRMSSGPCLGVLNKDIEIAVFIKYPCIKQFILHLFARALTIGAYQVIIRICRLRVFVKVFHVGVRRGAVEVEIVLLHIFAMVALTVGQSEEPFLKYGIFPIPQGQRKAEALLVIGDPGYTIFAPAVGAGSCMIVGKEIPGIAVFAVVLPDRSPLTFA